MIKSISQKTSNKKGFTLIELVVVIAILGILAALAIPRFGGFTDKAKVAADEQYAALVGNAVVTMLAAGDVTGNVPVSIAVETGKVTSTNVGLIQADLEKLVTPKKLQTTSVITFEVKADGSYTVPTVTP